MVRMKRKTTEMHLLDILIIILLFYAIATCVRSALSCINRLENAPSIEDLHQQQEMRDYHHSLGNDITLRDLESVSVHRSEHH